MTTKLMLAVTNPNSPQFDGFPALIGFGYEFRFFPISKHRYGTGNGDICIHLEPKPKPKHVSNVENYFIPLYYSIYIRIETHTLNISLTHSKCV